MTPFPRKDRATKNPGITKLEDGRFLVLKTWIDPNTGIRRYRRRIVAGTMEDAIKARAELREQKSRETKPLRPRFADFAESWLARHSKRRKLEPSTLERYTADVAHLTVDFGQWWVDAITFDALEKWQADIAPSYAAPTINGWHRTMRLILDSASRNGIVRGNPARDLPVLPEKRTKGARGTALSSNELRAFIQAIPACVEATTIPIDIGRALLVLAWTGMRIGEVIALQWSDIADGEIHVDRSVWRGMAKSNKTDDPRRVTIVEPLREAFADQRQWLLSTQHAGIGSGLVFPASPKQVAAGKSRRGSGDPCWFRSQSTIQGAVREVCKAAKCPRITPHSLRRTFEDLLREAGVEQLVRRAVAGWRSDRAQGIYATVKREDRDAAADAVRKLVLG